MLKQRSVFTCAALSAGALTVPALADPPPANDTCAGAIRIPIGTSRTGSTTHATFDGVGFCGTGNTAPGVWYAFTGDGSAVELTTCHGSTDYDTKITVFSGSCGSLSCEGGNDDIGGPCGLTSRVRLCTEPGVVYYVLVHGWLADTGNFGLHNIELIPPQPDEVCDAQWVPVGSNTPFDNRCADAEPGEVSPGAGTGPDSCNSQDGWCFFETDVQSSLWYTFTAPPCGGVQIGATSGVAPQDYQLAVYSVGDCGDFSTFTEVAANDDSGPQFSPRVWLCDLTPGATYYVQVDGFGAFAAPGVLRVHPFICNDCNNNGIDDDCDIYNGTSQDCNNNGIPDECDIASGFSIDCNNNGVPDDCDIANNTSFDCNCNGVPDECDILNGLDVNGDGFVDSCVLCAGDTNCDGVVNYVDMTNVWANIGTSGPLGDVNYDGTVNFLDYFIVAWNYGSVCN